MVRENTNFRYWRHSSRLNEDEKSTMSRTLQALDILDAGGVNGSLVETEDSGPIDSIIDPSAIIKSTIFRQWGRWKIQYYIDDRKIVANLNTRYRHIAEIKQDELEASLSNRMSAFAMS